MKNHQTTKFSALVLGTLLLTLAFANTAYGTTTVKFDFLVSGGFVKDLGVTLCSLNPPGCPSTTMASNGDIVSIRGSGTFTINPFSVTASGTFVHRDSSGNLIARGTWVATQILFFKSFGSGSAQGLPSDLEGGRAAFLVNILVGGLVVHTGILTVNCLLGSPPANAVEGITLNVPGTINFNTIINGITVYINKS
jgi:hypothetical protein